ncbi:cell envelope integrity protein TolA [Pseudomonas sp. AA-38]|uniref:cell envelope integrity protein TolA n=1 Tax=Pseudomonas sp. AA-38 TaxID=3028807 RepID=UPI0023F68166|nr:cell envelope integrity protein TolA [Pseudomonas sp. AA-38]
MQQPERPQSESYFWPIVWAVGLHVLMFAMLFVSFAFSPELPPARPVVQATLYQLKSQSQATTQTTQKIAGEAQKTSAPQFETERLEQKKAEEQKVAAAKKAEEQKQAEEARKAEQAKAEAAKAEAAKKAEAEKAAEQKRQADIAKKRAEEEAKKKAAEEAKKKAAEEAKKKAAEEAKKKAAAEAAKKKAAEEAKKKAEAAKRKAAEDQKAAALADLLSDNVERQQTIADTHGDQVAGSYDDLIRRLVSESWSRPPSARNGMSVVIQINMLPDGTITNASVSRSSGDSAFDSSAVSAVRAVGRIPEMREIPAADFAPYRSFKMTFTPEDLSL